MQHRYVVRTDKLIDERMLGETKLPQYRVIINTTIVMSTQLYL